MAKVAFLGLGVMGYPMAGHLKTKGHDVTVYNRTAAKAEKWVEEFGGRAAPSAMEAAKGKEFVFACVGNDDDLRAVTTGAAGAFESLEKIGGIRRSHNRLGDRRARAQRDCESARIWLRRCPGIRRPGRRRGRCAQRHVRRRA